MENGTLVKQTGKWHKIPRGVVEDNEFLQLKDEHVNFVYEIDEVASLEHNGYVTEKKEAENMINSIKKRQNKNVETNQQINE